MKNTINSIAVAVLSFPAMVAAQGTPAIPSGAPTTALTSVTGATTLFNTYVQYAINLFWVMTVLFGIFAAFKYLTAKGDPKAAESAKQMVIYTVIAACVALLATVVKQIAGSILGG
jgi:hypothetical protein